MVDQAITGKIFCFCYLTYGCRIANRTDSLHQTVTGYLGTLIGENPLLLLPNNFQASIVSSSRRRDASAWLAEETRFPEIIPPATILKAVGFIIQFWKKGVENIFFLLTMRLLIIWEGTLGHMWRKLEDCRSSLNCPEENIKGKIVPYWKTQCWLRIGKNLWKQPYRKLYRLWIKKAQIVLIVLLLTLLFSHLLTLHPDSWQP